MRQTTPILELPIPKPKPCKKILDAIAFLNEYSPTDIIKVKIRYRYSEKSNVFSLFLQYWNHTTQTNEYHFTKRYIYGIQDQYKEDKQKVKEAGRIRDEYRKGMLKAEAAGNPVSLSTPVAYKKLIDYFQEKLDELDKRGNTYASYNNCLNYVKKSNLRNLALRNVTEGDCRNFSKFLKQNLYINSSIFYFQVLKIILNKAVTEDKLIQVNPAVNIKVGKKEDSKKEFLLEHEIKKLIDTPIAQKYSDIKNAFLFSCYTGLRLCDVSQIKFTDIQNGYLVFRQQKTKNINRVPIKGTSQRITEKQRKVKKTGLIFGLDRQFSNMKINNILKKWIAEAGIEKHIFFHCSRNSFATLMLTNGVDVYTVTKLMGHKNVAMTEEYLNLIDKKRDEAIDKLPVL